MEASSAEAAPRPIGAIAPAELGAILAHLGRELLVPLETLRSRVGGLLALEGPGAADDRREQLATMGALCDGLIALTGDSLDLAAVSEGAIEPRLGPIDLASLVADLDDRFASEAARRGLAWSCTLEDAPPASPRADVHWCRQILGKLIANALQAAPEGGSVRVTVASDGRGWSASVADTGPGMPAEILKGGGTRRDREARHEDSHARNGLGLALCRALVARMGGRIEFDSSPGRGTRVEVHLPGSGAGA